MDLTIKQIKKTPKIDHRRCSGCNKCIEVCKSDVLELKDLNQNKKQSRFFRFRKLKAIVTKEENCTNCGKCIIVCKHNSISFD